MTQVESGRFAEEAREARRTLRREGPCAGRRRTGRYTGKASIRRTHTRTTSQRGSPMTAIQAQESLIAARHRRPVQSPPSAPPASSLVLSPAVDSPAGRGGEWARSPAGKVAVAATAAAAGADVAAPPRKRSAAAVGGGGGEATQAASPCRACHRAAAADKAADAARPDASGADTAPAAAASPALLPPSPLPPAALPPLAPSPPPQPPQPAPPEASALRASPPPTCGGDDHRHHCGGPGRRLPARHVGPGRVQAVDATPTADYSIGPLRVAAPAGLTGRPCCAGASRS